MTTSEIRKQMVDSLIKACPDQADKLKKLYNITVCNDLVNEQMEMLSEDSKYEAMQEINRVNGQNAHDTYLKTEQGF